MNKLAILLDKLLLVARDVKIWLRILILVITLFAGAILFSRSKKSDCTVCEGERAQLLSALLDVRKGLSEMAAQPTSYIAGETDFVFAAFTTDTTKKPLNKNQMQQRIQGMMNKIDSVLLQRRIDSLKRVNKTLIQPLK